MDPWREGEIRKVSRIWRDIQEQDAPWLVVFALTRVGGRMRCVGMEMRSYVGNPMSDEDAVRADAFEEEFPRLPVTTTRLRRLQFSGLLRYALREEERRMREVGDDWLDVVDVPQVRAEYEVDGITLSGPEPPDADLVERVHQTIVDLGIPAYYEGRADDLERAPRPRGRPRKHTDADLRRVAKLWLHTEKAGSPSPTLDVATAFGYTRNVAAKLVMRCRKPTVGLLPPVGWEGPWPAEEDEPERMGEHEEHP